MRHNGQQYTSALKDLVMHDCKEERIDLMQVTLFYKDFSLFVALGRLNGYLANIVATLCGDWFEDNLLTTNTCKQLLNLLEKFLEKMNCKQ